MQTEILSSSDLSRAAELLKRGEIVAFPTETVYGLGASIFNPEAIKKIFYAKGRPSDNPLIAHISSLGELEKIVSHVSGEASLLMEAFFPGALTLIFPRKESVPAIVSGGLPTLAVRMPDHPVARELIQRVGEPLVAPSANLSGRPSSTRLEHVLYDLSGKIAAVVDGGDSYFGVESTVLTLDPYPLILRPGSITPAQIEEVLNKKVEISTSVQGAPLSPGMKYRHYAPKAPLKLFFSQEELSQYLSVDASKRLVLTRSFSSRELYSLLRLTDEQEYAEICLLCDAEMQQDLALMNRLRRAAASPELKID